MEDEKVNPKIQYVTIIILTYNTTRKSVTTEHIRTKVCK